MKRAQYTKILNESRTDLLERLAQQLESSREICMVRKPEAGLVMHKARDAVTGQPFYIGEILVTECTVQVDGAAGYGACIGEQPEKAYRLALVDAAFNAGFPEVQCWKSMLLDEESRVHQRFMKEHDRVLQTKVSFSTADEYSDRGR